MMCASQARQSSGTIGAQMACALTSKFLSVAGQTFLNDLGQQQKLFTAQGQQLLRPEMFAGTANQAFYKQFAQSGVQRSLEAGIRKELRDSGSLLNTGLMDGQTTLIRATSLTNQGSGRIYGDHLSVAADTLTQSSEKLTTVDRTRSGATRRCRQASS